MSNRLYLLFLGLFSPKTFKLPVEPLVIPLFAAYTCLVQLWLCLNLPVLHVLHT